MKKHFFQRGTTNGTATSAARATPPVTTNQQPDLFGLSAPAVKPSNPVSPVSAQPIKLAEPAVSTPSPSKPGKYTPTKPIFYGTR